LFVISVISFEFWKIDKFQNSEITGTQLSGTAMRYKT